MTDLDMRSALILATLCMTPTLIDEFEDALDRLEPTDPHQARLAGFLLGTPERDRDNLRAALDQANLSRTLENLLSLGHVRIAPCVRAPGDTEKAALCLAEEFAKLAARRGIQDEMAEALEDLDGGDESRLGWRLNSALHARQQAESPKTDRSSASPEDDSALSKRLRDLIETRPWEKKTR
jgi:DNA primase